LHYFTKELCSHEQGFHQNLPSNVPVTVAVTVVLTVMTWLSWAMQHNQNKSISCCVTQGSQGQYRQWHYFSKRGFSHRKSLQKNCPKNVITVAEAALNTLVLAILGNTTH
jgi:hypothetical protein